MQLSAASDAQVFLDFSRHLDALSDTQRAAVSNYLGRGAGADTAFVPLRPEPALLAHKETLAGIVAAAFAAAMTR